MIYILLGCVLVFATVVIHAVAMVAGLKVLFRSHAVAVATRLPLLRPLPIGALVVVMFLASCVEALMWAVVYVELGAFDNIEDAGYFSMVTLTTLGYGDVLMDPPWRILAGFEAANGVIVFGWTTALIYAAVQRVYFSNANDAVLAEAAGEEN